MPLETLQAMTGRPGRATVVTVPVGSAPRSYPGWGFQDYDVLLKDIKSFVQAKSRSAFRFCVTLMALALLAIFNTQILSIWHAAGRSGC